MTIGRYPSFLNKQLENDMVFGVLYIYQVLVATFCSTVVCGIDTLLFSSLVFHKYQMKIFGFRLSKCGHIHSESENHRKIDHIDELNELIKMHIKIKE